MSDSSLKSEDRSLLTSDLGLLAHHILKLRDMHCVSQLKQRKIIKTPYFNSTGLGF